MVEGFGANQRSILETQLAVGESRRSLLASGAPLIRLTAILTIDRAPDELRRAVTNGQAHSRDFFQAEQYTDMNEHHEIDADDDTAMMRAENYKGVVQPIVQWLATGSFQSRDGFLLLSLDGQFSALAGIGWVYPGGWEDREGNPEFFGSAGTAWLPSGMIVDRRLDWAEHIRPASNPSTWPQISVAMAGNSMTMRMDIGQRALNHAILRYSASSMTTAGALPNEIFLMSWAPSRTGEIPDELTLPFDSGGVREVLQQTARRVHPPGASSSWGRSLRLQLIPNDRLQLAKSYILRPVSDDDLVDGIRADENHGYVRIWHGRSD